MLNRVTLIGRLTNDIELRQSQSGVPFTYFTIAVNRPSNNDQTDFVSCVAWRGTSELMNKYVQKGSLIAVEGRLEVYRTQNSGNYETRTNVNVQTVQFLDNKRSQTQSQKFEQPVANTSGINFEAEATQQQTTEVTTPVPQTAAPQPKVENKNESSNKFEINFDEIKF